MQGLAVAVFSKQAKMTQGLHKLGLLKKSKSINHRVRGENAQRSQRINIHGFTFVYFVMPLCPLWLKLTFSMVIKKILLLQKTRL